MDDVVGLSGHERHVESVEHDAGLQIGREGPSDDPARPGVENDRKVEKSGQRRQEGDVGHPRTQLGSRGANCGYDHDRDASSPVAVAVSGERPSKAAKVLTCRT